MSLLPIRPATPTLQTREEQRREEKVSENVYRLVRTDREHIEWSQAAHARRNRSRVI